ncbi:ABC transporter permease [Acidobacteria bacterium AB60]|nr:ABC transporter permease [Acidobacteria bacterium AB60]
MNSIRILLHRLASLFQRQKLDADLDEELRSHIDLAIEENLRRGMTLEEARRAALRSFGGVSQTREDFRMQRGLPLVEILARDARYAWRQLFNAPAFTITAIVTLALGIGANTAIFTLVHGILLSSLPVSDPSRLYRIGDRNDCCYYRGFQNGDGDFDLFSYDLYLRLKQSAPEFEQLAAVEAGGNGLSLRYGSAPAVPMRTEYVSGNYFASLGVNAYAGRMLNDSDDRPDATPAIVLSYQTWQSSFASDPNLVGATVYLQAHPFVVAGIAPSGFFGDRVSPNPPDLWMPLQTEFLLEGANSALKNADEDWLYLLGRVRPGVHTGALQQKLSATLRQWLSERPVYTGHGGAALIPRQHVVLAPAGGGIQRLQEQTGRGLRLLMGLSSIVLLIACANIANLLLARYTARRSDIAMRMALGASRRRVVRQILTESLLLSLLGGAAGLALAYAGSRMILTLAFPHAHSMPLQAAPSLPVLGFALLASLLTGIVFGTAPAWLSSLAQPADALRGANRTAGDRSFLPQRVLIVLQVALSTVLLAIAFLTTRSLRNLEHQDFGIATDHRYMVAFDPSTLKLEQLPALYRRIEDTFSALPGMADVSLVRYAPLGGNNWGTCVILQGHPAPGPNDHCFASWDRASTRFLQSIGVPIVRGRNFSDQDIATSQQVVLVNQAFVRQFFPNQDPLGKHFGTDSPRYSGAFEIIGVFADFKMSDARGEVKPLFFRPLAQQFTGYAEPEVDAAEKSSMYVREILLHFTQTPPRVEALVRKTLASVDPGLTVMHFDSYDAQVAANFDQDRLLARLVSLFGILALALASIGLYGVMSYFVARRTGEIGIRMALGAERGGVVALVLRRALVQIALGLVIGLPAALLAGRLMRTQLYGLSAYDPLSFVAATAILMLCATLAGFLPARRAASINPMRALRTE